MKTRAGAILALAGCVALGISLSMKGDGTVEWRPFYAEFTITGADGVLIANGKYWRARDGSDRRELDSIRASDGIQIRRIADRTCYRYRQRTGWTAQPMLLPEAGWRPSRGASANAKRIIVEGFEGLRTSNASGDWRVELPAFDFFRAARFTAASHRLEQVTHIAPGEPDPTLFLPPSDANLTRLPEPAGIIWTGSPASSR